MPRSVEVSLISSVLFNGDIKTAIGHGVTAAMFHTHQDEWEWMEEYYKRYRKSPSRETFLQRFDEFRTFKVNDTAYFVEEVRKAHAKQLMLDTMNDVAGLISEGDIDGAVRRTSSSIVEVAAGMGGIGDTNIFTDFGDVLRDVESRVKRVKQSGSAGIPFGFDTLDELTGGAGPGDFIIIGARLGHGKSWVLQKMAAHAAAQGHHGVFNALEQSRAQVTFRVHALLSSSVGEEVFRSNALMRGKDFDIRKYRAYLRKLRRKISGCLNVSDASRGKVSALTVASQIERHQPDIMYIDYLTLMSKKGPDWQGVAELSGDMKTLGTSYGIPIIAAAQLNREHGLGRDPAGPEALSGSDAIGQDADIVITQKQISRSVLVMRMAKNRNGVGDHKWYVEFRPGDGVIREVSWNTAQDLMDHDKDIQDKESA